MSKQEINIKITAKKIGEFQSIVNKLNAIGDIELVNKFERAEEVFDMVKLITSEHITTKEIILPRFCKIAMIDITPKTNEQGNLDYFNIEITAQVKPEDESISSFVVIFYIRGNTPNVRIVNKQN